MANPEHVEIVWRGTDAITKWRESNKDSRLDLSGADLTGLHLENADFFNAQMSDADMQDSVFDGANFSSADLRGADMSTTSAMGASFFAANLDWADFYKANLIGAEFSGASCIGTGFRHALLAGNTFNSSIFAAASFEACDLSETTFKRCFFPGARFDGAVMMQTVFADCHLGDANGLDTVIHHGPSTIGIDTVLRSEGGIPHDFLRGCGIPTPFTKRPQQGAQNNNRFYTCFLSHSHKDEAFVKHILDKLQGAGVRCWYFPETARTGEPLRHEIDKAIHLYDKLVIICSYNALESKPVIDEIQEGLKREEEEAVRKLRDEERVAKGELDFAEFAKRQYHTNILFPIMIDDYLLDGWKHPLQHVIKNRVVADFRNWKQHDTFSKQLDKLLRDLNTVVTGATPTVGVA